MTELEYLNVFLLYTDTETATPVCVLFKSSFNTILTTLQEIWGKCIYSMSFQGHFWIRKGLAPSNIIWILFDYFFSNKKGTFHPFHDVGGTSPPCPPCPPCPHAPHAPHAPILPVPPCTPCTPCPPCPHAPHAPQFLRPSRR